MDILQIAERNRLIATQNLDPEKRGTLGQFFTNSNISLYISSLFDDYSGSVRLLDPGCGSGCLSAAFANQAIHSKKMTSLEIVGFDVEDLVAPFAKETFRSIEEACFSSDIDCTAKFELSDYLLTNVTGGYTHCIMNPPYKKISSDSEHRTALSSLGIETVNLYSGFVAKAIHELVQGGELVAIIPRSFCNGSYYQPFRELILRETAIKKIHIFESREDAFSEDAVLQENIIIHLKKGAPQSDVLITASPCADFSFDESTNSVTATDLTRRVVPFSSIVKTNDKNLFFYIVADPRDQLVVDTIGLFDCSLEELGLKVSTGPVVDFRLKQYLVPAYTPSSVPLIYPKNIRAGVFNYPVLDKKSDAIILHEDTRVWLWENQGNFVLINRLSSKEEKRRIVASVYDGSLESELIGFDNKLNVIHSNKKGIDGALARGLFIYLNSTIVDKFYRLFGGHTQVNAGDLRSLNFPSSDFLIAIGNKDFALNTITQAEIDNVLNSHMELKFKMNTSHVLNGQAKIERTIKLLGELGLPAAQRNERSALTLLALLNLHYDSDWTEIERPIIGVTPIMDWCRDIYGKDYAPNTRETFRRQTLHQFCDGGLALYNPDKPDRAVNSPKACYQIAPELFAILPFIDTDLWESKLSDWKKSRTTLVEQYAKEREMSMIPLIVNDGTEIKLSPGEHSQLIKDIVVEFGPRFAPGAEVVYLGDTGAKEDFFNVQRLAELGVTVNRKGKLPDVVMYWKQKNWLLLIESVTSHGPVDGKRHGELRDLFAGSSAGLVYVTAFPTRKLMTKYLADISWETEVWVADAPTHMIHFNGDRFLGPHD